MDKKRVFILVEGIVQGVFFRATARDAARSLKVTGWVRNRWDGKVELLLEGDKQAVDRMIEWSHKGPAGAVVTNVQVEEQPFGGDLTTFSIRY